MIQLLGLPAKGSLEELKKRVRDYDALEEMLEVAPEEEVTVLDADEEVMKREHPAAFGFAKAACQSAGLGYLDFES